MIRTAIYRFTLLTICFPIKVCSGRLEIELVPGNHETFVQGENAAVTANCFVMCNHGIPRCD